MMKLIHGDCRDYIDDVVKGEGNPVIVSDPPPSIINVHISRRYARTIPLV